MPDWKQIVRQNLSVLAVCAPEFTEELAAISKTATKLLCVEVRRQR